MSHKTNLADFCRKNDCSIRKYLDDKRKLNISCVNQSEIYLRNNFCIPRCRFSAEKYKDHLIGNGVPQENLPTAKLGENAGAYYYGKRAGVLV